MEAEDLKPNNSLSITSELQLKQLLTATFRGESQEQTDLASHILSQTLAKPGFIELLAQFIQKPAPHQNDLKVAAANLVKNYSEEHARHNGDRAKFIEILYNLIMQPHLEMRVKYLLGNALRNQLQGNENDNFKRIARQKVLAAISSSEGVNVLGSCLVVIEASYQSLLGQSDKIIDFIMEFIQPLSSAALQIYTNIFKLSPEEWSSLEKISQPQLQFLLEFLRAVFNQLNDDQNFFQDKFAMLRKNQFLTGFLQSYLILFRSNGSILARNYPSICRLKKSITALLLIVYYKDSCSETIFNIIFETVIVQSKNGVNDNQEEAMLVDCLTFLEMQLENGHFINTFKTFKSDLIFALLTYSVSTPKEYGWMATDPYLFAQLAEQYTEGVVENASLKVSAASLLRIYAEKLDEIPLNIFLRIMIIISTSIHPQSEGAKNLSDKMKEQFGKYKFFGLNDQQRVETCLMVLSALEVHFKKRPDFKAAITSFFADEYSILSLIQSPIVSIRLIRAVSYYPSTTYFPYIESKMSLGKVFALQGIKSLERIIRTNRDRIDRIGFEIISSTLLRLISEVRIQDPIMELVVINYYDQAIKINAELYAACRWKIKESFFANARLNSHATMICFNLLYSLLSKEKDHNTLALIEKDFYEISAYLEQPQQRDLFSAFYEKIIEIYQILLEKCINITTEIERFALSSLNIIRTQEKGTQIFKFYNSYLIKLNGSPFKLEQYFQIFWEQTRRRFQLYLNKKQSPDTIPYFCFLMSQIITSCTITLNQQDLKNLIKMGENLPKEENQYPLLVVLTILYVDPSQIITFIKNHNIYNQFRIGIAKVQYRGTIATKIYNLAYMTFASFKDNPNVIKREMLIQSIINLREQNSKARNRIQSNFAFEFKPRRGELQAKKLNGFDLMRDQNDDNQLVNLFGKFKHPFDKINEFELFRAHYRTYSKLMKNLQPNLENDLRSILQTEFLDKDTMRIIQRVRLDKGSSL